ncbi:MAG: DUF4136 domain-containing protein [Planctomycetota bacterium]
MARDADFTAADVRTYAWDPAGNVMLGVIREHRATLHAAVIETTDAALAERGWVAADAEAADVWLRYAVGAEDRYEVTQTGTMRIANEVVVVPVKSRHTRDGELAIDVLDPATRGVLWRGIGAGSGRGVPTSEEVDRRVRRGVTRILEALP